MLLNYFIHIKDKNPFSGIFAIVVTFCLHFGDVFTPWNLIFSVYLPDNKQQKLNKQKQLNLFHKTNYKQKCCTSDITFLLLLCWLKALKSATRQLVCYWGNARSNPEFVSPQWKKKRKYANWPEQNDFTTTTIPADGQKESFFENFSLPTLLFSFWGWFRVNKQLILSNFKPVKHTHKEPLWSPDRGARLIGSNKSHDCSHNESVCEQIWEQYSHLSSLCGGASICTEQVSWEESSIPFKLPW